VNHPYTVNHPKVSVIIPVFRVEKYIYLTLKSVFEQTFQDFEILIIDDGSPDTSIDICKKFEDHRLKIIRQSNRGLSSARNTGIRNSLGEFIAFLDGDDLWLPDKLEKHLNHLASAPDVGISFCRSELVDEKGNPLGTFLMPKLKELNTYDLLCGNPVGNGSAAVVRREVLDAIRYQNSSSDFPEYFYFDENFRRSEDIELWLRIIISTPWKIEGIPDVLTLYRVNDIGLSSSLYQQLESWNQVLEKTHLYAPLIISQWENISRAYQLQYLSRRAITLKDDSAATHFIICSLISYWRIILLEPRRIILTFLTAYSLRLLPRVLFLKINALTSILVGVSQKRRISKDLSEFSL
jgi:glycosyltransferase involved in cell wall biosynthesis